MYRFFLLCSLALILSGTLVLDSCQHEPFLLIASNGADPTDTGGNDTTSQTDSTVILCSPDTVYFRNTILPLLVSNCSMSGCHDATSHKEDVVLTSYASVRSTGEIKLSKPRESELYKVLIKNDPKERMPEGKAPLPDEQIAQILKWIEQGAKDNYCNECDSTQAAYALNIRPIIVKSCQGCHSGTSPGGGFDFTSVQGLQTVALNGKLVGAVSRLPGFKAMPESGKLPDCDVSKIREWVRNGALNN